MVFCNVTWKIQIKHDTTNKKRRLGKGGTILENISVFKEQEEQKLKAREEGRTKAKPEQRPERAQSPTAASGRGRQLGSVGWHGPLLRAVPSGTLGCSREGKKGGNFPWFAGPSAAQAWSERRQPEDTNVYAIIWKFLLPETKMTAPNIYRKLARYCSHCFLILSCI